MRMKKGAVIALSVLMALGMLSGCSTSKKAAEATTQTAQIDTAANFAEGLNEDGTLKDVKAEDYVTVCDYKEIPAEKTDVTATDDEVQAQIDSIMAGYKKTEQIKDRAVKDGDTVNIDFNGKVDGKEFEGGQAQGYDLVIGSKSFIDDFEDQLVGKKPGDKLTVKVTFPDDYGKEDLQGKDAEFDVTVNYIAEEKEQKLTDEFVKENLSAQGYTSVKDMKQKIKDSITDQKKMSFVQDYLMKNSKFKEIPKELVEQRLDVEINGMKAQMENSGYKFEDYLKSYGFEDEKAMREQYYSSMEDTVKMFLLYDAIAAKENLKVEQKDVDELIGDQNPEEIIKTYSKNYVNRMALNTKVLKNLAENVKVK